MKIRKSGMILPYVMVLGAALLVLAVALLTFVNVSASQNQNNLEYSQAFINARSAVSFAQGVLLKDMPSGNVHSFYVTGATDSGNRLVFSSGDGAPPADMGSVYAVCSYTASSGAVEITGYLKTPTYSRSQTIKFQTVYKISTTVDSADLGGFTDIGDSLGSGTVIANNTKIVEDTAFPAVQDISIQTNLLVLGDTADIRMDEDSNKQVTLSSAGGEAFVPVIVKKNVVISKNQGESDVDLSPGNYLFSSGGAIDKKNNWKEASSEETEQYFKFYGFSGGTYHD